MALLKEAPEEHPLPEACWASWTDKDVRLDLRFQDRLSLEAWLRGASQKDRDLMNAKFIPLDWERFWELGAQVRLLACEQEALMSLTSCYG